MAYYEPSGWQAPPPPVLRHVSWDEPVPSGIPISQYEESLAFVSQFEEVDRAIDNLMKSGKLSSNIHRRDSMPLMVPTRPYDIDPRFPTTQRHSIADIDGLRHPHPLAPPPGTSYQGFSPVQPFSRTTPTDSNQMLQTKRMAAQRDRDFRNHHLSQQSSRAGQPLYVNDPPYYAVSNPASAVDEYRITSPISQRFSTAPPPSVSVPMSMPLTTAPTNPSRGHPSTQPVRTSSQSGTPAPVLMPGNKTNPTSPIATGPYGSYFGPTSLANSTNPSAFIGMPLSGPPPIGSSRPPPHISQINRTPSNATSTSTASTNNATNTHASSAFYPTEEQSRSQSHPTPSLQQKQQQQQQQQHYQASQFSLSQLPQLPSQQQQQITTDNLSIHSTPPLASPVGSTTHRAMSNQSPSASSMLETSTKGPPAAGGIGGSNTGAGVGLGGWATNSGVWRSKKAFGVQASVWG